MKKLIALVAISLSFSVYADKESFVVKRKHVSSTSTLKEQCAQELGEVIKLMPELQERLANEQQELARIEKTAIHDLYDLLEDKKSISKQELQTMLDHAVAMRRALVTDYEVASQQRVALLKKSNDSATKVTV